MKRSRHISLQSCRAVKTLTRKRSKKHTLIELASSASNSGLSHSELIEILKLSFDYKNGKLIRDAISRNSSATSSMLKAIFLTDGISDGIITHPKTPKSIISKLLRRLTIADRSESFFRSVSNESDSACIYERAAIRTIELLLNHPHTDIQACQKLKKLSNWVTLAALSRCEKMVPQDLADLYRGSRTVHLESSYLLDAVLGHKKTSGDLLIEIATNMIRESYEDSGFYYFWDVRYSRPVLNIMRSERIPLEVRRLLLQQPYLVASASRAVDEIEMAWTLFRAAQRLGAPGNAVLRLAYNKYVRGNPELLREVILSDEFVRKTIAEGITFLDEKFEPWVYELLSKDLSDVVRAFVASNPYAAPGTLAALAAEFPSEVRDNPSFLGEAGSIIDYFSKR